MDLNMSLGLIFIFSSFSLCFLSFSSFIFLFSSSFSLARRTIEWMTGTHYTLLLSLSDQIVLVLQLPHSLALSILQTDTEVRENIITELSSWLDKNNKILYHKDPTSPWGHYEENGLDVIIGERTIPCSLKVAKVSMKGDTISSLFMTPSSSLPRL